MKNFLQITYYLKDYFRKNLASSFVFLKQISVILLISVFSLQANSQSPVPKTVKVAVAGTSLLWLNYFWAQDNGYFKDAGINVVPTMTKNGPMSAQAVLASEADVGMGDFARVFNLRSKGVDLVAFAVFNVGVEQTLVLSSETAMGLSNSPSIDETVKAMKGKTIAISGPGTTNDVILRYLIKSRNQNPDQYLNIVSLASSPALYTESFKNKSIDGLITTEPIISEVLQSGTSKMVFTTLRDMPPADKLPYIVAFSRRSFAEANRDALIAFNRALARASVDLRKAGYDGSKQIVKKYFPTVSEEAMRIAFTRMQWPAAPALDRAIVKTTADWQADVGLLPSKVPQSDQDKAFIVVPAN